MEIKIENILILWDEKVTDIFVSLINTLSLSFSETEIRNSMAKLSENDYHDNKNDHQRSEYLPDGRY